MNSNETLTCNLFQLPQDIFRVIFQYLTVKDLMKGEEAFLDNQELLSLYLSSLAGFTITDGISIEKEIRIEDDKFISWIIDHKLFVEELELSCTKDIRINLLNQFRSSLKSIHFTYVYSDSNNSVPVFAPLGHFPSLTSVTFFYSTSYFTNDKLLSFFSHNPQLETVAIHSKIDLSHDTLPHLSNYCPKVKIIDLFRNDWVNDETMSLLTQRRLFPNLKSVDIRQTEIKNQESLRQFILSHPLLCGLLLPQEIQYSDEFLIFYLRQVIFPSILRCNNLESHSLALSSLSSGGSGIFDGRNDVVTPEIFSVDILSHLYHKGCSFDTVRNSVRVFSHLSKFPSMIDSILQSQFIPFILNYTSPHNSYLPFHDLVDLLFDCGVFHDSFPCLVEKYRTHLSSLVKIFQQATKVHFSLLTTEELQTMIPIVLSELRNKTYSSYECLKVISKLLQEPSSQLLVDPNTLLFSFKSFHYCSNESVFACLGVFISVNENYQQLLIESNLLPQIMTRVDPTSLLDFANHCLSSSGEGLLVGHLVDSGLFQYLLSKCSQLSSYKKSRVEYLFKDLIEFKNNKYSEIVREMELPEEFRVRLFEKRDEKERRERV